MVSRQARSALAALALVAAAGLADGRPAAPVTAADRAPAAIPLPHAPARDTRQSAPAGAQQLPATPQQPPVFRAGVKLVRVDVSVTGKGDQPVADLQPPDFEIEEDGVPQKVEQLQFLRLDGRRPPGDDTSLDIRSPEQAEAEAARDDVRLFVIFLDDYHIDKTPDVNLPLHRALAAFVESLWPSDLVAMADPLTPIDALHFTRSKFELLDVIRRFEGRQGEIFPVKNAFEEAQLRRGDLARVRAEVTLSALGAVSIKLGSLREGRKTILFVSQGPPTFLGGSGDLQLLMREVTGAANRANVAISCIDPRGLGMTGHAGARDTLYQLAADTGGRVVANTNDVSRGMIRLLDDTSAYYVLGYTPTRTEDDGRYHKISVKVRRPGVRVQARKGYWAPSTRETDAAREAAAAAIPEPQVARALDALAVSDPERHPVEVWVGLSRGDGGQLLATVTGERADPSGRPPASSLEVAVLPAAGGLPVEPARTLALGAPAKPERPREVFTIAPGGAQLRFTARSADGAVVDEWVRPVAATDLAGAAVALSTPRFSAARSVLEWRAIQASPDPAPNATLRFRRTDRVLVVVDCYTARDGEAPTMEAHLLAKDGRELAALPVPPIDRGRLRFELPIGSLGQGTYLLRVRAHLGQAQAEQVAAIRIVP